MFPTLKALTLGQQEAERRMDTQGMDRFLQRSSGSVGTEISEHMLVSWFRAELDYMEVSWKGAPLI